MCSILLYVFHTFKLKQQNCRQSHFLKTIFVLPFSFNSSLFILVIVRKIKNFNFSIISKIIAHIKREYEQRKTACKRENKRGRETTKIMFALNKLCHYCRVIVCFVHSSENFIASCLTKRLFTKPSTDLLMISNSRYTQSWH